MTKPQLLRLPCHLLTIFAVIVAEFVGTPAAIYVIKILIIFAACCWAADTLFGNTVWIRFLYFLAALVVAGAVGLFLRSPQLPAHLLVWALILSGDVMMLSREANRQHLHVRFDYQFVSVELLGIGMKRLVAIGLTLKLPKAVAIALMSWVVLAGLLLGFQAFKMYTELI